MKRTRSKPLSSLDEPVRRSRVSWAGVRRRWWLILLATVVTTSVATGIVLRQESVYEGEALVLLRPLPGDAGATTEAVNGARRVDTEVAIIRSTAVKERARLDMRVVGEFPGADVAAQGDTDVVAIRVRGSDPASAAAIANAYANAYIEVSREQGTKSLTDAAALLTTKIDDLQQQIDAIDQQVNDATPAQRDEVRRSTADHRQVLVDQRAVAQQRLDELEVAASSQSGGARITSAATVADHPVGPDVMHVVLLALGTGLLLGFALALLADFLDDAVHTPDDLARATGGLTVLSSVPSFQQPDFRPLSLTKPTDAAVEAYRTLRTELQFATKHMPFRVLQVTSPSAGEGTTTTAVNLAVLVALTGRRVALVDANLRDPELHLSFRADSRKGLTAALTGEPLIDLLHPVALSSGHLEVLPAGFVPSNPSETLGARRMRAVIEELASTFDLVVIDSAPVLRLADSVVLMGLADAVVLVTEAHRTSITDVRETMSVLSRASAPIVGTVLNRASS